MVEASDIAPGGHVYVGDRFGNRIPLKIAALVADDKNQPMVLAWLGGQNFPDASVVYSSESAANKIGTLVPVSRFFAGGETLDPLFSIVDFPDDQAAKLRSATAQASVSKNISYKAFDPSSHVRVTKMPARFAGGYDVHGYGIIRFSEATRWRTSSAT